MTVSEAEIAAGGPARRRGEPARRRAVGRADGRGARLPLGRGRPRPALDGPIVAVVSGGNVDPERYRAFLEAPIRLAAERRGSRASRLASLALARQPLGQPRLADPDRVPLRVDPPIRRSPRWPSRGASSRRGSRPAPARNRMSPVSHISPPAICWSSSGGRSPRPDERRVVGVEDDRRVQDRDREERVLGHLEEHVHRPDRVGHPPRARVEADRRPPEQEPRAEVERVLEVVDRAGSRATRRTAARSAIPT